MARLKVATLVLILILGFALRLYNFHSPIADWHSWRQADTSAVSRNFASNGFDILHPRFDDLSTIPSGKDNPQGYRFVEFPIYNFLQAILFKAIGFFTIEEWGRLISAVSSSITAVFLYLLVSKRAGFIAGIFSSFFYSLLPFSIYYGRTILPDTLLCTALVGGIYFFDLWLDSYSLKNRKKVIYFGLAAFLTASSLLLKPFALFFTIPLIYLVFSKFGLKESLRKWELWIFAFLTLSPLIFWRVWMLQFPEGIPNSGWLFNYPSIRFKGSFFYWIFAERIGKLILGYFGLIILSFGFFAHLKKVDYLFFITFILSSLLYLFTIARGNVQHDYYQVLIIPTVTIFMGLGAHTLFKGLNEIPKAVGLTLLLVSLVFTLMFSWYFVRDYYHIQNPLIVKAGKAVDEITPKNSKVIALYGGDTSFLYQTKRRGWPVFDRSIEDFIRSGADYLVILNPTASDLSGFGSQFSNVAKGEDFLILKLR